MPDRKKRILWVNEASYLATGFSTYGMEVMRRQHETGKYELAEFASYGSQNDPRAGGLPWKYYGNMPLNQHENNIYNSDYENQFGKWKFEQVLNDFRPDIVCDVRDPYFISFINRSPYREFFKFAWLNTVDSEPQKPIWLADASNADAIFTYTDYGIETLNKEAPNKINLLGTASPAADPSFKPVEDKKKHKEKWGIQPDINIVGTVMRNQRRKLYPDLICAFADFINQCANSKNKEVNNLGKKTFLYLHTSYPDQGFDIPLLIQRYKISNKVIVTYVCQHCSYIFPSFFRNTVCTCPRCKQNAAHMPNTNKSVPREVVPEIMNLFDLYVQYSVCEGFGMPVAEAAQCGVLPIGTDYSGVGDVIKKCNGWSLEVVDYFTEGDTHRLWATPSKQDLVKKLIKFFTLPENKRRELGENARKGALTSYNYDVTAQKWMDYYDSVEIQDDEKTWGSPPRFHRPNLNPPPGLSNANFIRWCVANIWGMPQRIYSPYTIDLLQNLESGTWLEGPQHLKQSGQPFNHQTVMNLMMEFNQRLNNAEQMRFEKNNPSTQTTKLKYSLG